MTTPRHRVSVAVSRMRGAADAVVDASVWSMDAVETAGTLVELTRLEAQVSELKARVAAHAEELHVGQNVGASSAASWLAHETKATRAAAYAAVRLGRDLEAHRPTRDALAAGRVLADQARVVIRWVEDLPDTVPAAKVAEAEAHLLALARHHDATALNRLGKHLFEVVAPAEADAREAALLAKEEAAAAKACRLSMYDDGQGKTHGTFTVPTLHGATLRKILGALAAPRHVAATQGPGVVRPDTPEAWGRALCELIERYPADRLPTTGGVSATAVVLLDLDVLLGRLEKAGVLDTGEKISPALARRLACQAGIIPVVLDGDSQPLDVGRKRRLFSEAQRTAMLVRDRGCRAEGCDRATGLHAHHKQRWTDGGHTNLKDGISLCPWHHARAHDTGYRTTHHPNGDVTFHRRT
ncbi:HNH endonuclease signature motif containing protein [Nocardioides sp. URHA0032]|uniref:HNH endonuclease signature motif containing protein n=1 Tax=Nocardioides sp. URHA0032 TaxID=1380388 RepID=UPI001E2D2706|nr:HNH endonuclease signature motif containing protein [Nocardioides sp. URHA0032]